MSSGLMRNSAQVASTSGRVYDLLPRRHSLKTLPFKAATLAATCKLQQSRIHSSSTSEGMRKIAFNEKPLDFTFVCCQSCSVRNSHQTVFLDSNMPTLLHTYKLTRSHSRSFTKCCFHSAVGQQFDGVFGKWTLDEQDRLEVLSYRAGLTVAAAGVLSPPFVCHHT